MGLELHEHHHLVRLQQQLERLDLLPLLLPSLRVNPAGADPP